MSLDVKTKKEGTTQTVVLTGRLDTTTAPELDEKLSRLYDDTTDLILDVKDMDYISSAGLRVVLKAQKTMNKKGSMKFVGVQESIMEIFEITGFLDFLTIEK